MYKASASGNLSRLKSLLDEWSAVQADAGLVITDGVRQELERVWAASDYVAKSCLRNPRVLEKLLTDNLLESVLESGKMSQRLSLLLRDVADEAGLESCLRAFRQEQMIRVIWRDITGKAPLKEILEDLSELADVCITQALELLYRWATATSGTPRDADGKQQNLLVLGMGKLGARELNLSSDIDLIFTFPDHGETDGRRPLANEQFFTRLGRQLISALGKKTAEGFVFRVDMRLRPFGDAGPLAISIDAMEHYYQSQAREWERYAMIKARIITGEEPQRQRLMAVLRPFVYRRYVDFGVIEAIRDMKRRIANEMHRRGMDANIKLGRGGIREIEFIGQAFQLVRGGREPELQIRPIQEVLRQLAHMNLIPVYVASELISAYEFLRRTENRIQAWKDEQTHLLPADEEGCERLANSMGFTQWADFYTTLEEHRELVDQHFQQVFATPHVDKELPSSPMSVIWHGGADRDVLLLALADAGFKDTDTALQQISGFHGSAACRSLSARAQEKLDRLVPLLLEAISSGELPDVTLARLLELLQAIVKRTAYLDLLLENPLALSQLVKLGGESSWVVTQLVHYPVLLDELLDTRRLYSPLRHEELERELDAVMGNIADDDLEQHMERMRQFSNGNRLRTAAADISGAIPLMVVSDYLTEIAETILQRIVDLAWKYLLARHGKPAGLTGPGSGFAVIGYGKLGGIELGYGSDLDMVFVHGNYKATAMTDGQRSVANDVFYARLGQRVVHMLTTRTPSGILYEADMRLRPNGSSGMLVPALAAFERYQMEDAWIWEHQALVRARPVAGDPLLMAEFEAVRRRVLGRQRPAEELRRQVVEMREKMRASLDESDGRSFDPKQGQGGIADIEFMVQYAVLRWAHQYPDLLDWTDNIRLLDTLGRHGLLEGGSAELLSNAYRVFRAVYHRSALQETPGLVSGEGLAVERDVVQDIWQALMEP